MWSVQSQCASSSCWLTQFGCRLRQHGPFPPLPLSAGAADLQTLWQLFIISTRSRSVRRIGKNTTICLSICLQELQTSLLTGRVLRASWYSRFRTTKSLTTIPHIDNMTCTPYAYGSHCTPLRCPWELRRHIPVPTSRRGLMLTDLQWTGRVATVWSLSRQP